MSRIIIIFDDTVEKREVIRDLIGNKGFSDVVVKKKRLETYYSEHLQKVFPNSHWITIHSIFEFNELLQKMESKLQNDIKIVHCFSNFIVSDVEKVCLGYEKLFYIDQNYRIVANQKNAGIMFQNVTHYCNFLKQVCQDGNTVDPTKLIQDSFDVEGLVDISDIGNFIQCITGNFDSRYFNSLQGNEYTLVKRSTNKKKIKSEYTFYHLLPEDMKYWYVMPFNYQENENCASYTMERLHMTDLAIKWVHGSIGKTEFAELLDKYFYFFECRHQKEVSKQDYDKIAKELYVDKVVNRIEDFKKLPEYSRIAQMIEVGCEEKSIDNIVQKYLDLKYKVEQKISYSYVSVIGHGDPCFANALYNKSTKTLKFIDPKGALIEEELWTNPYYDIAKLSHSVCGRYDFFNNALFDIKLNEEFLFELNIDFNNATYIEIFKKKLEEKGLSYLAVRLYEASLFISMLPLHIDYPHKVFGFILNVINILKEIEKDV